MDRKCRILTVPSDSAGVCAFRNVWPAQAIEKHFSNEFDVEIAQPGYYDMEHFKTFDIIHFHRCLGPYEKMEETCNELRKAGVILIMDIDDYWEPSTFHPLYEVAKSDNLGGKIINNIKLTDYITTTTDIFANEISKLNKNVHVIPNALDMTHQMWTSEVQENKSGKCRIAWIGGSCYDKETEILTENGFRFFKDLDKDEKVACLNPENNQLEYYKPKSFIKEKFKGNLQCGINSLIDYAVTPNHKMYVSIPDNISEKKLNFNLISSEEVFGKNMHFKKDAIWNGEEKEFITIPALCGDYKDNKKYNTDKKIPMDLWLKFFGFWIAEGWTSKTKNLKQTGICQVKSNEYLNELFCDLKTMGYNPTYTKDGNQVRVFDMQLWEYLIQFGGAYEKFIPGEILNLSARQLKILLDWYLKGDGSVEIGGERFDKRYNKMSKFSYNRKRAYTISKRLSDNIQEICLKIGILSTVSNRGIRNSKMKDGREVNGKYDALVISIGSGGIRSRKTPLLRSENQFEKPYDDFVYCVNVPHNIIYVRRNGKTMWCGNSHLHDLLLLKDSMDRLNSSKELEDKYQFVLCGFDIRGSITQIHPNGERTTRPIKPEETVWNNFEHIFTSNYSLIKDQEYVKWLKKIKKEDYPDQYMQNYVRRWTLPLTQYGKHYDYCDVCLAPLKEEEYIKDDKGTIMKKVHMFNWSKSELKLVEAGMKKKVLIAQNFGIYKQLLRNNENAILVSNNKDGWYKAIRDVINNPDLREKLSTNLHNFVKDRYELKNVTEKRVEFYKELLEKKKIG